MIKRDLVFANPFFICLLLNSDRLRKPKERLTVRLTSDPA